MTHGTDTVHAVRPSTTLMAAALDAAARGWSVLPCYPSGPRAKAPVGQLVPHGHLDASRDPEVITAWWSAWPAAMIGAAVPATLLVLDVDPRNGGSRPALETALGPLPATLRVLSGRGDGGAHLYYRRPAGVLTATGLPPGVDLKASGYCLLPPSVHPATGRPYRWHLAPVAHLTTRALSVLRPTPPPRPAVRHNQKNRHDSTRRERGAAALVRLVADAAEGQRSNLTYWAARRALDGGHGPELLDAIGQAALGAGLAEREVRATLASARAAHEAGR